VRDGSFGCHRGVALEAVALLKRLELNSLKLEAITLPKKLEAVALPKKLEAVALPKRLEAEKA